MKKIFSIAIITAGILAATSASAANVEMKDFINGIIGIEGKTEKGGEDINVLILNPDASAESAENDSSLIQYSNGFKSSADGSYSVSVKLKDGFSGSFPVYVKENGEVSEFKIYYAEMPEKIEAAKKLVSAGDNTEKVFGEVKVTLSLDTKLINDLDIKNCCNMLAESLKKDPISFDSDNPESSENIAKLNDLIKRIKTFAVLESFNQGKVSSVYQNGVLLYDDITELSGLSSKYDVTSYKLFGGNLTEDGKNKVISAISGKNIKTVSELQKRFTDAVMYFGISCNKEQGYGYIGEYISEKNVRFAKDSTADIADYLSLSDSKKNEVFAKVKQNQGLITIDNYLQKVNGYAKDVKNTKDGGAGGSSSGSRDPVIPIAPGGNTDGGSDNSNEVFADLNGYDWAKEAIEYLYKKNIINGTGENEFSPDGYLTREQAAKIICNAFSIKETAQKTEFKDVVSGAWYEKYVAAVQSSGIMLGTGDSEFGVGMNITRQDLAVILYRAMGVTDEARECSFTDSGDIDGYAKEAVAYFSGKGIINGYEDGRFLPHKYVTRAEAAKLIYGIIER